MHPMMVPKRLRAWLCSAALVFLCIVLYRDGFAAEVEAIGQPLPVGTLASSSSTTPTLTPIVYEWRRGTIADIPGKRLAEVLSSPSLNERATLTRGGLEIALYKKASPSVVFLLVKDGSGS